MRRLNAHIITAFIISVITILNGGVSPCEAVREGTANAGIMIKRYERAKDYGRAALWREAAAECLERISIPITKGLVRYHTRHGNDKLAARHRRERADINTQREHHLKHAKVHWAKSETDSKPLELERRNIAQFIATWMPYYPDKFYDFGCYPNFLKKRGEAFKQKGDYAAALNIEADAAELCAEQYNDITIAYFRYKTEGAKRAKWIADATAYQEYTKQYEKVRDAHRRRATLLRVLAQRQPKAWPAEADKRDIEVPKQKTALTPEQAICAAMSDARVKQILADHRTAHKYAWFQGFAWTVSFYNHGWGNLAIAIIDDNTGKVIDVLDQIGER